MNEDQQNQLNEQEEQVQDNKPKTFWITVKKKVSSLRFHPKNPRIITDRGIDKMQESMSEFGYVTPVVANLDNVLIAGHKRVMALLDWEQGEEEIEVRVPNRLLSKEEHEKLMLIDNKMEEGNWDWDKLNNEFDEVLLTEVGFSETELGGYAEPEEEHDVSKTKDKKTIHVVCPNCQHEHDVDL